MSHSVVTDFPTQTDNTLVVVVNKNGEVSVDQETLEGFMKLGNTEVSILRVDNEDGETVDMTLDTFDRTDTMEDLTISVEDEILRNYNSFRMDHCYTPLTSPSQQKRPVPPDDDDLELDDLAQTLSILEGSNKPSETPVKIQPKVVQKDKVTEINKVTKLGVQQQQKYKSVKPVVSKAQKVVAKKPVQQEIESDFSDDDLDSDFEESPTQLKKRIYNKRRTTKLEQTQLPNIDTRNKVVKVRKGVKHIVYKPTKQPPPPPEPKIEPVPPPPAPVAPPVPDLIKSPDPKKVIKKEKKPVKPVVVDDGIALFSTPDIIRRVGSGKTSESPESPKVIKPAKIEDRSRSDTRQSTEKIKTPQRLSVDSKVISPRNLSTEFGIGIEKPIEALDSNLINQISSIIPDPPNLSSVDNETFENIAQAVGNLESDIPTDPQLIRSIIHTDEPVKFQAVLEPESVINPQHVDQAQLNLEASGLDQALLDNINTDELIPDDILYQVAKLIENPDVQNVIDRTLVEGLDPATQNQISESSALMHINQQIPTLIENTQTLTKSTPQRPIQIVRPDGRVLILPPIEKPATRSSKKKQEPPQAQHRQQKRPPQPQLTPSPQPPQQQVPVTTPPKVQNVIRPIQKQPGSGGLQNLVGSDIDSDSDESWNSEDDPDRLWCICKQPHNNRFMICCDTCEDWFHGKCVNVTKAMGQQMEQQGKEWMCPNCLKKLNVPAIIQQNPPATVKQKMAGDITQKRKSVDNSPACIVCASPSRANSVYCSDTCILKHAQGVEKDTTNKAQKTPAQRIIVFERSTGKCLSGPNAPSAANLKQWLKEHPGFEVVRPVAKQPNLVQSKFQLVKNPQGKEGVALSVNRKGVQVGVMPHSSKQQPSTIKLIPAAKLSVPGMKTQLVKTLNPSTPIKAKLTQSTLKSPPNITPAKAKPPPTTPTPKPEKTQSRERKQKLLPTSQSETPKQHAQENIRDTVKKTLYEHLTTRVKESDDLKFTDDEVDKMAHDIETQLYKLFGDSGPKYRTKYRSLIFNIKDTKNQTLWRRICEKDIAPAQLVRLSPEEMASQELARWRERENKHQLDMIKKSELELLTINRTYVLKTHKGEHVMEDRPSVKVDSTEIMPGLGADSTSEPDASTLTDKSDATDHSSERRSAKHSRRDRDRDKRSNKDRSDSKDRRASKDHGSSKSRSKRSRSRDRDRDRSSHRSNDRKRSRSRDRHRSTHKSSRHKRDKHSTEHLDKKSREILDNLENNKIVPPPEDRLWKHVPQQDILVATPDSDSDHEPSSTVTIPTPPRSSDQEEPQPPAPKPPETDPEPPPPPKIQAKVEVAPPTKPAIRTDPRIKQVEATADTPKIDSPQPTPSISPSTSPVPPSVPSKFTSESKEAIIWEGNINMVDVAKFFITLHEVSGDCSGLGTQLPPTLEIVGRISPDTVWEYIGKMRRSNSKLISILRLTAGNVEEKMPYIALYSYLSSRDRLGVIKSTNNAVKDFYILPLASHAPVPQALLPLAGPGFEEARPHLLLGIIVRAKRKRASTETTGDSSKTKRSRAENSPTQVTTATTQPTRSYTPPPTRERDPRVRLPTVPVTPNDEDEPYSPEDSDPENTLPAAVIRAKAPAKSTTVPATTVVAAAVAALKATDIAAVLNVALKSTTFLEPTPVVSFEPFSNKFDGIPGLDVESGVDCLQRRMAELDKCIEEQKEEIRTISQDIVSSGAAASMATNLSSISLPSNLQQILDSIKNIPATTATGGTEEYCPSAPGYKSSSSDELTMPLLLPKLSSRHIKSEAQSTIPLKLPVAAREPKIADPIPAASSSTTSSTKSTPIAIKLTSAVTKPTSIATKPTSNTTKLTKLSAPKPTPIQVSLLKLAGISTSSSTSPVPSLTAAPIDVSVPTPVPAPLSAPIPTLTTTLPTILPPAVILPNLSVPPPRSPSSSISINLLQTHQKTSSPSQTSLVSTLIPPAPPVILPPPALTPPGLTPIVLHPTSAEVVPVVETKPVSVLSSLSEEELIRKAAEMLGEATRAETPEPEEVVETTSVVFNSAPVMYTPAPSVLPPPLKRTKIDVSQPPVPGLEDEFEN